MKRCTKCGETKSTTEFYRHSWKRDGLRSECKACNIAYKDANRDRILARQAEYHEANKERINARMREYHASYPGRKVRVLREARQNLERSVRRAEEMYR